jgi:hypothetical protein
LSGGTITSTGTLVAACPSFNSVGSYVWAYREAQSGTTATSGTNYSAGASAGQITTYDPQSATQTNNLSGTWKWMGTGTLNTSAQGVCCRVS